MFDDDYESLAIEIKETPGSSHVCICRIYVLFVVRISSLRMTRQSAEETQFYALWSAFENFKELLLLLFTCLKSETPLLSGGTFRRHIQMRSKSLYTPYLIEKLKSKEFYFIFIFTKVRQSWQRADCHSFERKIYSRKKKK